MICCILKLNILRLQDVHLQSNRNKKNEVFKKLILSEAEILLNLDRF